MKQELNKFERGLKSKNGSGQEDYYPQFIDANWHQGIAGFTINIPENGENHSQTYDKKKKEIHGLKDAELQRIKDLYETIKTTAVDPKDLKVGQLAKTLKWSKLVAVSWIDVSDPSNRNVGVKKPTWIKWGEQKKESVPATNLRPLTIDELFQAAIKRINSEHRDIWQDLAFKSHEAKKVYGEWFSEGYQRRKEAQRRREEEEERKRQEEQSSRWEQRREERKRKEQQTYAQHQSLKRVSLADASDIKEAVSNWMEGLNDDKKGRLRHFLKAEKLKTLFESRFFAAERNVLTGMLDSYEKKQAYKNFLKNEWGVKVREKAFTHAFSKVFHPTRIAQMNMINKDVKVGLAELYAFGNEFCGKKTGQRHVSNPK